ncbi:RNA polymerase sigma-70 factor, ECF subfamily [Ekhidna lutea]|uniref:RNA polymerase sigma-70 factor, ECF subfamily n=1 Tax=Ekhidna lutea TaxID=447679 RepID=A0A239FIY9_EKHLU|nr:sigma-70 family RNA polymerase sigma factor [Ekhidna lutea]SNS56869.1 RNA polymerase sigma-70 factor, ECF subfamily [Ekhidna lutea]
MTKKEDISPTDELQLQLYRNTGNQEVIGELFNKYMHLVYGLCLKYLKNRDDAQDAVMEIYEHIGLKLREVEVNHFKSWLYMVSKNHCLMQLRKNNPVINSHGFMESKEQVHLYEEKEALESDLDALEGCIEELKKEQRQCVKLFFLDKKSYQQVNEETGLDLKKIKSHIQNGKRNLKMCLERKNVKR